MKYKCIECGHVKEVMENECMGCQECIICGAAMAEYSTAEYLEKQASAEKDIQNETEGINEVIDTMLINKMTEDINKFGAEKMWNEINLAELELRLLLIPIFFEAQRKLKEN